MPANRPLTTLLSPECIRVGLAVSSKPELLETMTDLVSTHPAVTDAGQLLVDIQAREEKLSTGVGNGLALPHARTEAASESLMALATLARPVDYAALDGEPVQLVVLLVGPETDRVAHLHVLGRVSRVLADAVVRQRIEDATSAAEVVSALRAAEAVLA